MFTSNEVRTLFEYAVQHQEIDVVELALKAAQVTNSNAYTFLSDALEKSDKYHRVLAKCLVQFGQYDQFDLIFKLLQNNSIKVKFAAIFSLEMLSDPRALEPLKEQIETSDLKDVKERAINACRIITEKPVTLPDNTVYTFKLLTPLKEADFALADFLLNHDLSDREVPVLVKRLFHPRAELKKQAEKELLRRGEQISDSVLNTVATLNLPLIPELVSIFSNYKDTRIAHPIIQYLKSNNKDSDLDYQAITALGTIGGEEAALYLAELTVQQNNHSAAYALKETGKIPVSYILLEYKSNSRFRHTGALNLLYLLGANALQALLEAIQDRYKEVRENAKSGLIELGIPAVEPLIELINLSSDVNVQLLICSILGKIADKRAIAALDKLAQSKNKYLQQVALEAICVIKDPISVHILSKWIESPDRDVRKLIIKGLWNQDYTDASELLIRRVYDTDKEIRVAVIDHLDSLARKFENIQSSVTNTFLTLLKDEDKEVADLVKTRLIDLGVNHKVIKDTIDSERKTSDNERISILYDAIQHNIAVRKSEKDYSPAYDSIGSRFSPGGVACLQEPEPPPVTIEIPSHVMDTVQLAVSAPLVVCLGHSFILDVWACFDNYRQEIYQLAKQAQRDKAIMLRAKSSVRVQRDSILTVRVKVPDFKINQEDIIYWGGTTGNCTFPIKVPMALELGFHLGSAHFYVGPLLIAKLDFEIEVGLQQKEEADITTREQRIRTAFASYASDDRNKVLGRIQGMLKLLPELDIFLDVASLRSGEDWEKRLEKEIKIRDVFYLFWSSAASKSQWVEKEWRTALLAKGIDCIDPVPLEPPNKVPPPPELSSLHFHEWTLAYQK